MAGRAYVNRVVQVGVETTPGTAVPANKSLPSLSIDLTRELTVKEYRSLGYKVNTTTKITKDFASGKLTGPLGFTEIVYPLSTIVAPVITTPTNGVLTRKWVFTPKATGANSFKTLTIQEGDSVAALQAAYCIFTQFGIDLKEDDATVSGTILGRNLVSASLTNALNEIEKITKSGTVSSGTFKITFSAQQTAAIPYNANAGDIQGYLEALTNIDPGDVIVTGGPISSTPVSIEFTGQYAGLLESITVDSSSLVGGGTYVVSETQAGGGAGATSIALLPIGPREIDVYIDAIGGTIGSTKVVCALNAMFDVSNTQAAKWCLNTSNASFVETVEMPVTLKASFNSEFNSQARALYDAISSSANPYYLVRFAATGPVIESVSPTYNYSMTLDLACQIIATKESDTGGVYAYDFSLMPLYSSVFGNKAFEITIYNVQTSL